MKQLHPQPDPRKARTPHRRQAFTQLPQPSKNNLRELQRQRQPRVTGPCSEVKIGKLAEDGSVTWISTDDEYAKARMEELANKQLDVTQRKARLAAIVAGQAAEVDSWASKR